VAATRRLAAIVFTDMVGFTASAQTNEAEALKLLREQEKLVRPLLKTHQGREIKSTGDGFLIEFDSALRAVQCAIDIHQHLQERNSKPGCTPVQLRIGVHLGDVEERGNDIFGDAVNIASRIVTLAPPGGICVSGQVFDQVRTKVPNRLEKLPPTALKHVLVPMDVYRLALPWEVPVSPPESAPRIRLAVLPLTNISPDPKDEYFADGLTEELISALSKIRDLRVIARTSVGQYKSTSKTVSQIGAELGASSVLEGSVRKSGNRLRITLQLIDASTQDHVWANIYDRELDDVFAVQTDIAERTAGALRLELLGPEREAIRKETTTNLAAYDFYLKGIHAARQRAYEDLRGAIPFFEDAIRSDPSFAQAYAWLANVLIGLAWDELPPGEAFPRARELVTRALELDPNSSDAHTARGNLALQYEHDYGLAEAEFERAISLNPSNALAHLWQGFLLTTVNRFDEATREFRTTSELDPLYGDAGLRIAQCLSGDFASAIASAERARDGQPDNPQNHLQLAVVYADAGRRTDARREVEISAHLMRKGGEWSSWTKWTLSLIWAEVGRPTESRRLLRDLEEASRTKYVSPQWIAIVHAALGDKEKAFEWLERNDGEAVQGLWLRYQWRAFDSIRDDPRFRSMLGRLGLPTDVKWARPARARRRPIRGYAGEANQATATVRPR
jgi:adenylate cyclase